MSAFSIHTEAKGPMTMVRLVGWAGLDSQPILEREITRLSAVTHTLLVLDLTELTGMCSLAIGQFVALQRAVQRRGGRIRIGGTSDDVRIMLERCKMDSLIPMYPSPQEAAAAPHE